MTKEIRRGACSSISARIMKYDQRENIVNGLFFGVYRGQSSRGLLSVIDFVFTLVLVVLIL